MDLTLGHDADLIRFSLTFKVTVELFVQIEHVRLRVCVCGGGIRFL